MWLRYIRNIFIHYICIALSKAFSTDSCIDSDNVGWGKTVLIISHRDSSLKICDKIFKIQNKEIKEI